MATKIGVGHSTTSNSKEAGKIASQAALENGKIGSPQFALLFFSGKHNPYEFSEGVHEVLGDIPMAGGSALGVITRDYLGYEGYEAGITIFESDDLTFSVLSQAEINKDEYKAGQELGKKIAETAGENDKALLVFYDSSKNQNPPMLNFATLLFKGIEEFLPKHITTAGGGFLADMMLNTCYQFVNREVLTQTAVAVLVGNCNMHTTIMHGCRPASSYLTITKTNGPVIFEINNRPALEVIDELLGNNIPWKDFALFVTLGVNRGEKFGPFNELNYANRLTLAVDEQNKALIMFEPDLKPGDDVQLMRRSLDLNYMQNSISDIRIKLANESPLFAFYIDCAGRAMPYSGGEFEDAVELQKSFGSEMPFMGFYSGVEIARVGDHLQPLDWTGVLCVFSK
jgi:hypothetical protein